MFSFVGNLKLFLMEAKELRIGNYYQYAGNSGIVTTSLKGIKINEFGFYSDLDGTNLEICKPIPLTEEILFKFGFEKIENGWKVLDFIYFKISWERLAGLTLTFENESIYLPHIKYLHQLQNLYFALTNEELTVNL